LIYINILLNYWAKILIYNLFYEQEIDTYINC